MFDKPGTNAFFSHPLGYLSSWSRKTSDLGLEGFFTRMITRVISFRISSSSNLKNTKSKCLSFLISAACALLSRPGVVRIETLFPLTTHKERLKEIIFHKKLVRNAS